jgi:hypothetical protein
MGCPRVRISQRHKARLMLATRINPPESWQRGAALKLHRRETFGEVSMLSRPAVNGEKRAIPRRGTPVAITYLTLGVPPYFARNASSRGGAHNLATRESHALSRAHVGNLMGSALHADAIGLPFTRMITVHWEAAGVALDDMARATGRFIDMLSKTLARHKSATAWLWVHESGHGKGGHCHILAHVPAALVAIVTRLQRRWLRTITGTHYRARVIHSVPIGGRLGLEGSNPALHAVNRDVALSYVLKGACADAAALFGLDRLEPGGRIIGKRCGTSQNIGAKARANARIDHEQE